MAVDPETVRDNFALTAWLKEQARFGPPSPWDIDAWELHTHPDLVERVQQLAPAGSFRPMYGVPVLVHPGGIIFAYAIGTLGLTVRTLVPVPERVRTEAPFPPLDGWIAVDPWPVDIEMKEGTATMMRFMRDLYAALSPHPQQP